MQDKNNKYMYKNHRIANLFISLLIMVFFVAIVLLNDSDKLFKGIILPILIVGCAVLMLSITADRLIDRYYRYSWVRSLERLRKENKKDESYNLYPIDPKLIELDLTPEQYDLLVRFRIVNFLLYCLTVTLLILKFVDFSGNLVTSVILPIIMITGASGVIFVCYDMFFEFILKKIYKKKNFIPKIKRFIKDMIICKNNRIYYVPICTIIGIILIVALVNFDDKLSKILPIIFAISISDIIVMILIDFGFSKYFKMIKGMNEIDKSDKNIYDLLNDKKEKGDETNEI